MHESKSFSDEKKSYSIVVKNKDIEEIENALREAESQLNASGELDISKASYRSVPGLDVILISVTTAFLIKFAEKFGENLADWLSRKLSLKENDGEKISEVN